MTWRKFVSKLRVNFKTFRRFLWKRRHFFRKFFGREKANNFSKEKNWFTVNVQTLLIMDVLIPTEFHYSFILTSPFLKSSNQYFLITFLLSKMVFSQFKFRKKNFQDSIFSITREKLSSATLLILISNPILHQHRPSLTLNTWLDVKERYKHQLNK